MSKDREKIEQGLDENITDKAKSENNDPVEKIKQDKNTDEKVLVKFKKQIKNAINGIKSGAKKFFGKDARKKAIVISLAALILLSSILSAILMMGDLTTPDVSSGGGSSGNDDGNTQLTNATFYIVHVGRPDTMSDEDYSATVFPSDQVVYEGELIYILPTPSREGYIFSGWYYDSDLTMLVSASDVVNKNMTVYPYMRPANEIDEAIGDGSIHYVSETDAEVDFRVTVKAPSLQAVQNGIYFESISSGEAVEFTVDDNGDGTYTINPNDGLKAGRTYQITAIDREKGIEADGRVPTDDEYVLFVYNGEVQHKQIRFFNIFTKKEEVNNLKIDNDVSFISLSSVENFGMEEASGIYKASYSPRGGVSLVENNASGTFYYEGDLEIGQIVAIHDGDVDLADRTVTNGEVAYIEIIGRENNVYYYVSAKAKDVVFLPDVIPIPRNADIDYSDNTVTVHNDILDFTYFENQDALNGNTTVDVGDYIALYNGTLQESDGEEYAKIISVEKGDVYTVITFQTVTLEELQLALDTYTLDAIDMTLTEDEISELENQMMNQAISSSFAEQSVAYVGEQVFGIGENIEYGKKYRVSDSSVEPVGVDVEAGNVLWYISFDVPNFKVNVSNSLEKIKSVNGGTGLRAAFGITIPVSLELVETGINGRRVIESYHLDLYVTFEQEVAFSTSFSVDVKWDNWLKIIWWIDDVAVNAGFEVGSYTGFGAVASIYTEKYYEKTFIWNELVEDKDRGSFSSASNISEKLNNMLKDGNLSFFNNADGSSLADEYKKMMEREVDYVDILVIRLFHSKGYADPKTRIVNYVLDVELVFGAKVNVTMGVSFENLTAKYYSFNLRMFDRKGSFNVIDKQTNYSNFNLFIMGNLGVRAGVRVTLSVGLISVKLDNLGAMGELGLYLDLYGFFYFHYDWKSTMAKPNIQSGGALYAVLGIYMDLDIFGGVLMDLASFTVHLYENEWPLWEFG